MIILTQYVDDGLIR